MATEYETGRGACADSDDGKHEWALSEVIVENVSGDTSKSYICNYCGAESYEAAASDPDRPAL